MSEKKEIKISAAKGRPMLSWVGKRPLRHITAFPAQHIETFAPVVKTSEVSKTSEVWKDWPAAYPHGGLLFHGDNKEVLAHLLANGFRGKVKLIYIDPPFDSGADYVRKVQLRGGAATAKIEGESYTLGEQIQYTDIWANDNYLQFMYERLQLLKELLAEDGSIALHCDAKRNHYLRILLEEVFGTGNFRGEIIVKAGVKNVQSQFEEMSNLTIGSNTVFLFSKASDAKYRKLQSVSDDYEPGKWDTFWRGTDRPTMRYKLFAQKPEHGQWRWEEVRANQAIENYSEFLEKHADKYSLDEWYLHNFEKGNDLNFLRLSDDNTVQYFVPPRKYKLLSNVWFDLPYRGTQTDYPTEKNEAIVGRLIEWITCPGDLVLDCFIGSGTTSAVAQKLGRRWIGCDINKGAIQTTAKRLQGIIEDQIEAENKRHPELFGVGANGVRPVALNGDTDAKAGACHAPLLETNPAQQSFTVWRVNDYDLKIQRNEAIKLACEHVGVERIASEGWFDGKLGKKLVKIIPFEHPLSPLDLEESKRELEARPEVENTIVFVCLGIELAARTWIEDWNRLRKGEHTVNKIEVIELRTDAKYGNFIKHEPATAKVCTTREGDKIKVQIEDFISPTILKRLDMDLPLFKAKITDWRSQVDCVMIDTAYNGEVFNVTLSDVPEKKNDLIDGTYTLPAPTDKTTVAVKIIDMLGEEVLVTEFI